MMSLWVPRDEGLIKHHPSSLRIIPTELAPLPQQHAIPVKPAQTPPPSTLPTSCLQDSLGD